MAKEDGTKYQRIAADLRARIESGEYPKGEPLPGRTDLKAQYGGVSQVTVEKAVNELKKLGLVETRQGTGTFVIRTAPGEPVSEFDAVMTRMDEVAAEVRQLRARMDQYDQQQAAGT